MNINNVIIILMLIDPDEDNSDYNAGCEIGLMTSETYYIIINSITRNTSNYRIEIVVNESYD